MAPTIISFVLVLLLSIDLLSQFFMEHQAMVRDTPGYEVLGILGLLKTVAYFTICYLFYTIFLN